MLKVDKHRFKFLENDIELIAEEHTLIALAEMLRKADVEGTWSDLVYQIEYAFDIDDVRSADELECPLGGDETNDCADCAYSCDYHFVNGECVRREDENYTPSAENGDYSPSDPWRAPGMSINDFI